MRRFVVGIAMADTRKIDWNNFERLPGSPRENFEILWRSLILDVYGGYGALREYYNHTGVEFVFELHSDVKGLGRKGDKVGWQCKYPDKHDVCSSPSDSTRQQAEKSLSKITNKGFTKCYICVPHDKLLKADEDWVVSKSKKLGIELQWQTNSDILRLFDQIPNGAILHEVWFGELALSNEEIREALAISIEPVKTRYVPELQVETFNESDIRRRLFERAYWVKLDARKIFTIIWNEEELLSLKNAEGKKVEALNSDIATLHKQINQNVSIGIKASAEKAVDLKLKELNDHHYFLRELEIAEEYGRSAIVGVMADAGGGKTCLGISVAQEVPGQRPAGVFLLARDFRNGDINTLAKTFHFRGRVADNMQQILAILDTLGRINKCKMPLVIDGLNESREPKLWKDVLARLVKEVELKYKHVLLVVTFRSGEIAGYRLGDSRRSSSSLNRMIYATACLPTVEEKMPPILELGRWDAVQMRDKYLKYYKINAKFLHWPDFLEHPLGFALYCKSVNRERCEVVNVESPPLSLNFVFKEFCMLAANNIAASHSAVNITPLSVFKDLVGIAGCMLESGVRELSMESLDSEFVQSLMSEGIALKRLLLDEKKEVFEFSYDALAGYLMAEAWLTSKNKDGQVIVRHEMSGDILSALVYMYYERCDKQFITDDYPVLSVPALAEFVCEFPESQVDDKVADCVLKNAQGSRKIISVWTRRCLNHLYDKDIRFNVRLLDSILSGVGSPALRDASWGVLVFDNIDYIANILWKEGAAYEEEFVVLYKWLLASNVVTFRDRCLHLLVKYGRKYPRKLFDIVVGALKINDEYVRTGMAKAGYAVAMSLYAERGFEGRGSVVVGFANEIAKTSLITNAPHPVWSRQTLDALVRIVELAKLLNPGREYCALNTVRLPYTVVGTPFKRDDEIQDVEIAETKDSLRMDFENYSMTRLVGEHSYQTGSDKYKKALRAVQSRMYQLGFRCEIFKDYDRRVPFEKFFEIDGHKYYLERFGKKYQMIAYEEMATTLSGVVCHYERDGIDSSIDPCLPPEDHEQVPFDIPFIVDDCGGNYKEWLENGKVPDFSTITKVTFSDVLCEEWILVNGFLQQTLFGKQETFVFFDGLVVDEKHLGAIKDQIKNHRHYRIREDYELYYLEYPWSTQAVRNPDRPQYQRNAVLPQYTDRYVIEPGNGFEPEVLVREYEHEDYHEGSRESYSRVAYIPEPYVALALKLHPSTGDYNWRNDDGSVVFRYFRKESDRNIEGEDIYYNLVYIRKRELLTYLKARKKAFILCSNGERTLGYEMAKNNINVAKDIGYDYRKAEFTRWYLCLGCDDYKNMADKLYCVLPKYNINYWECMRYKVRHLCRRIKEYLLKPFQSENIGFYLSLLGDDSSLFEKILVRKWSMAQVTYNTLLEQLEVWRKNRERTRLVCFCDANGLAHGWRDKELAAAYRKADAVVADGIIMVKLAKVYGGKLPGRVIGPVLFEKAMEYGVSRGWRHFFCGTNEETLAKLKSNMEAKFPGVKIVGTYAPEYSADPKVPKGVDCDFMWVALGSPKQEKWCAKHLDEFKAVCVLPVGAAFDFHAGTQKPVPQWVHKCGICWLWRMCTGGWRVLKRDLWCVPRAAWILASEFVRVRF